MIHGWVGLCKEFVEFSNFIGYPSMYLILSSSCFLDDVLTADRLCQVPRSEGRAEAQRHESLTSHF